MSFSYLFSDASGAGPQDPDCHDPYPTERRDTVPKENRFQIITGDIASFPADIIVNAANTTLEGGGSVDSAIHQAAGPELLEECRTLGGCPVGEARLTRGYRLPCRYVIHTPGPVWQGGEAGEAQLLASCYQSCLTLACQQGVKSISFPSISTGIYHFPVNKAARIATRTILDFLREDDTLERVTLVCFDERTNIVYNIALKQYYEQE